MGVREDGQKVLLLIRSMGGQTTEAWQAVLGDLVDRGLRCPEFLITDRAPGLLRALAALWGRRLRRNPLRDQAALVLGHRAADLQQELVVGILAHRSIEELDLAACG